MLFCLIVGVSTIEVINLQFPETIYSGYDNFIDHVLSKRCDDSIPYGRNVPVWYMVCFSENVLGNARIIPLIAGIALLPLVFFISKEITNDRRVSIFATLLVSLNPLFLIFNDSSAYNQIWAVAFLGAVLIAHKKPIYSIPFFVFAVFAKPMAILFIPVMLVITWKDKPVFFGYLAVSIVFIVTVLSMDSFIQSKTSIFIPTAESITLGFENLWFNLTKHTTILTIPFIIFSMLHKNRLLQFFIISSVVEVLLLPMFTIYTTYPYRLLPMFCFVSIGVSLAAKNLLAHKQLKKHFSKEK